MSEKWRKKKERKSKIIIIPLMFSDLLMKWWKLVNLILMKLRIFLMTDEGKASKKFIEGKERK